MIELYQDILNISKSYMGLAAEEYIERRCRVSLSLNSPSEIKKEHLERFAAGIEMTAGAYMKEEKAKRFKEEILALEKKNY